MSANVNHAVLHEYRLRPEAIASWLESSPRSWWSVDGDRVLQKMIDFPCPAGELADAFRSIPSDVVVLSPVEIDAASAENLDQLANTNNNSQDRELLCRWDAAGYPDDDWLLTEDKAAQRLFGEADQ